MINLRAIKPQHPKKVGPTNQTIEGSPSPLKK